MHSRCAVHTLDFGQHWPRVVRFTAVVGVHAVLLLALQGEITASVDEAAQAPLIVDLIELTPVVAEPQPETPPPVKPVRQRVVKQHFSPSEPPARQDTAPVRVEQEPEPARSASPTPVSAAESELAQASVTQPAPAPDPQPPAVATAAPSFDAAYLNNPAPVYPRQSRRAGEAGRVVLRVLVTPEGRAGEVALRETSGFDLLDEAAVAAVRQWRFVAARRGDITVAAWVVVPLRFDLDK